YARRHALHAADDGWNGFKWLNVEDRENSVFAFMRSFGAKDGVKADRVVCVYNFTPVARKSYDVALPEAGTLSLLLNSDDERYGGAFSPVNGGAATAKKHVVARKKKLNGLAYSATLSVPPLCAMYYGYVAAAPKPLK
ncbi:MAG: alpha amylase C-terminal domain-containing protein, partial [Clostridiales Family XIII bacterium]|nr:alpha amylase C-terminal domain-containing protein [Clostridiales Family XIII bacterium]